MWKRLIKGERGESHVVAVVAMAVIVLFFAGAWAWWAWSNVFGPTAGVNHWQTAQVQKIEQY